MLANLAVIVVVALLGCVIAAQAQEIIRLRRGIDRLSRIARQHIEHHGLTIPSETPAIEETES